MRDNELGSVGPLASPSVPSPSASGLIAQPLGEFSYSAGNDESFHDEFGRIAFPRGQSLYHRSWYLVVTDLAEDFRAGHDGWECTWPLEFRIYEDGAEVARFDVECEFEPTFSAYHKDLPAAEGVAITPTADGEVSKAAQPLQTTEPKSSNPANHTEESKP